MKDLLVNRDCVILDGSCDCPKRKDRFLPDCKLLKENKLVPSRISRKEGSDE